MAKNNNTPDPQHDPNILDCCSDCSGPFSPSSTNPACPGKLTNKIYLRNDIWTAIGGPDCSWPKYPICCDMKINTFECLGSRETSKRGKLALKSFELDHAFLISYPGNEDAEAYWAGPPFFINGLILRKGWDEGSTPDYRIFRKQTPKRTDYHFPNIRHEIDRPYHRIGASTKTITSHVTLEDTGGFYNPETDQGLGYNDYVIKENSFGSAFTPESEPDFQITIWVDPKTQLLSQTSSTVDEFCGTHNNRNCHFGDFRLKSIFTTTGVVEFNVFGGGPQDLRQYPGYCDSNMGWNGTTRSAVPPLGKLELPVGSDINTGLGVANKSGESETDYGTSGKNISFVKNYIQTHYGDVRDLMGIRSFDAYVWTGRNAIWTPPT
jgi:hypothetical protein